MFFKKNHDNDVSSREIGRIPTFMLFEEKVLVCPECGRVYPYEENFNFCPMCEAKIKVRTLKIEVE